MFQNLIIKMTLTPANTILLFGVLQSIVMIVLILTTRKWQQIQNRALILLLLVLGVSILPSFIGNSKLVLKNDSLQFLPLHLSIFVFPLLFLYFKSIFTTDFRLGKKNLKHLVVPVLFWLYYVFIWINTLNVPVAEKGDLAKIFYYFKVNYLHDIILLLMVAFYTWSVNRIMRKVKLNRLSRDQIKYSKWLRILLLFLIIGFVLDLSATIIGQIYDYWNGSPVDRWLGISFTLIVKLYYAVIVYVISVIGYASYSNFTVSRFSGNSDAVKNYLPKIINFMETEKPFLSPNLSLSKLAEKINTTSGITSAVLNNGLDTSFNDFVNKYRIEEVKNKMKANGADQFTLLALAQDSGFKSKTTFYRAFQKFTSHTPKSYLDSLQDK